MGRNPLRRHSGPIDLAGRLVAVNAVFTAAILVCKIHLFDAVLSKSAWVRADLLADFWRGVVGDLRMVVWLNDPVLLGTTYFLFRREGGNLSSWLRASRYYYAAVYTLVFAVLYVDFQHYSYLGRHIDIYAFKYLLDDSAGVRSWVFSIFSRARIFLALFVIATVPSWIALRLMRTGPGAVDLRGRSRWIPWALAGALIVFHGEALFRKDRGASRLGVETNGVRAALASFKTALLGLDPTNDGWLNRELSEPPAAEFRWIDAESRREFFLGKIRKKTKKNRAAETIRPNVVLILREGYGADFLKYNSPEFDVLGPLKKYVDRDYTFRNFFPGSLSTHGSLQAVLCNLNASVWQNAPFLLYNTPDDLQNLFFMGAAVPFKNDGYSTAIVLADYLRYKNLEAMGFDSVVSLTDKLKTRQVRNSKNTHSEYNGVHDEFLYKEILARLSEEGGTPKFIVAVTVSNHEPFEGPPASHAPRPLAVPEDLRKRIVNADFVNCFLTYQYASVSLAEFMDKITASALRDNTIVAVTGDHPVRQFLRKSVDDIHDAFGVPLHIHVPEALRPRKADTSVFGGHVDVMPTLYNLALSDREYYSLGNDLFDPGAPHVAVMPFENLVAAPYGRADFVKETAWVKPTTGGRRSGKAIAKGYFESLIGYARFNVALSDFLWDSEVKATGRMYRGLRPRREHDPAVAARLDRKRKQLLYRDRCELWAHRGYTRNFPDNTIPAYQEAIALGAKGIEMDVWYDERFSRYVVSHDRPYQRHHGKLLFLDDVFEALGSRVSYWLDFKTQNEGDTGRAVAQLETLLDKHALRDLVYLEAGYPHVLEEFSVKGVQTIWALPRFERITRDKILGIREFVEGAHLTAVSFDVQYLVEDVSEALSTLSLPAFTYTLNEERRIRRLAGSPNVRVVLVDVPVYDLLSRARPDDARIPVMESVAGR